MSFHDAGLLAHSRCRTVSPPSMSARNSTKPEVCHIRLLMLCYWKQPPMQVAARPLRRYVGRQDCPFVGRHDRNYRAANLVGVLNYVFFRSSRKNFKAGNKMRPKQNCLRRRRRRPRGCPWPSSDVASHQSQSSAVGFVGVIGGSYPRKWKSSGSYPRK